MKMTSRKAEERAVYSASVVLNAIRVCSFDFHKIGHPVSRKTKLVRVYVDKESVEESDVHAPAQSVST